MIVKPPLDLLTRVWASDEIVAALLVLVLTPFVRFLWLAGTVGFNHFREWAGQRVETCRIELGPFTIPLDRIEHMPGHVTVCCLTIRYGLDEYLERLASEQEKFEGRTRLRIDRFVFRLDREARTYRGKLAIRVHKRLGTQFKLFIEADGNRHAESIRKLLQSLEGVVEVARSDYGARPKVWFLLDQFHILDVTGGAASHRDEERIRNNFYFPV